MMALENDARVNRARAADGQIKIASRLPGAGLVRVMLFVFIFLCRLAGRR
jgi:hypothetical protein